MATSEEGTTTRRRAKRQGDFPAFDRELADWPPELRWREWMGRIEAVVFAAPTPVCRAVLRDLVGAACPLDDLIADIRAELGARSYDLVEDGDGVRLRVRSRHADALRAAGRAAAAGPTALSETTSLVLMAIAYLQPVTRGEIGRLIGRAVNGDVIADLRAKNLIASGPRSPQPGAPSTYVTTPMFLERFGLASLRDLPDREALEDMGLWEEIRTAKSEASERMMGEPQASPKPETIQDP